jgi:hypothetical protein
MWYDAPHRKITARSAVPQPNDPTTLNLRGGYEIAQNDIY